jgi:hypothetical protein
VVGAAQPLIPVLAVAGVVVWKPRHPNHLAMVAAGAGAAEEQAVLNDPPLTLPCHGH